MGAGGELPMKYQAAITFVTMSCFAVAGFFYQQRLIKQYYNEGDLALYERVKRIHQRELADIAAGKHEPKGPG